MKSNQVPSKFDTEPPAEKTRLNIYIPSMLLLVSLWLGALGLNFLFYNLPLEVVPIATLGVVTEKADFTTKGRSFSGRHMRLVRYSFASAGSLYTATDWFGASKNVLTELPEGIFDGLEKDGKIKVQFLKIAPWLNRMKEKNSP